LLYPGFYTDALQYAGRSASEHNIKAVAQLTSKNLALNAQQWFRMLNDGGARSRFDTEFNPATNAEREPRARLADDMIDFVWAWTPKCHAGLRDFVRQMPQTIAGSVAEHGDVLPEDLWTSSS
jgi:hypothetical protein